MATVTSWVEHLSADEVAGAVYPFIGTEWLWLTIAVVFWLWFHIATGAGFAGFAAWLDMTPADSDMFAIPDPDSLIQLPWN